MRRGCMQRAQELRTASRKSNSRMWRAHGEQRAQVRWVSPEIHGFLTKRPILIANATLSEGLSARTLSQITHLEHATGSPDGGRRPEAGKHACAIALKLIRLIVRDVSGAGRAVARSPCALCRPQLLLYGMLLSSPAQITDPCNRE